MTQVPDKELPDCMTVLWYVDCVLVVIPYLVLYILPTGDTVVDIVALVDGKETVLDVSCY
jgi:hypothetical protein